MNGWTKNHQENQSPISARDLTKKTKGVPKQGEISDVYDQQNHSHPLRKKSIRQKLPQVVKKK